MIPPMDKEEDKMTVREANKIIREFEQNQTPSEEDEFLFIEAMEFL